MLPAQSDAGWSTLPITAHVASIWLKNLLRAGGARAHEVIGYGTGTHSCKATVLSWAAKFGLDSNLVHDLDIIHEVQVVYARDSMAQPLRDLNRVLEQVREGQFDPDATRSGYFPNSARAPVSEQPELSSSSEGSED